MSAGEVASGFRIMSTSSRRATMTMLSCVAIVETKSEVVECDMGEVQRVKEEMRNTCLSREAERKGAVKGRIEGNGRKQ